MSGNPGRLLLEPRHPRFLDRSLGRGWRMLWLAVSHDGATPYDNRFSRGRDRQHSSSMIYSPAGQKSKMALASPLQSRLMSW
jgi:hypothetical protein